MANNPELDNLTLDKSLDITDSMGEISPPPEPDGVITDPAYKPKIRKLVIWPDARLTRAASVVETFDEEIEHLVADMFATMKNFGGVGIAAPQIGVSKRIICIWIEKDAPLLLINPLITFRSEETFKYEEGCLSIPGYYADRKRPQTIHVDFQNVNGEKMSIEVSDLYAFAIQHEIDHLEGKTFVDELSSLKKIWVQKKVTRALRHGQVNGPATDESVEPPSPVQQ